MFANMNIGMRMGLGFALILIMTAFVAVIGITRMSAIKKDFNTVIKVNNVKVAMANGMRDQLNSVVIDLRNIILQKDVAFSQKQKENIIKARKQYDEMSDKISSLLITEKGKQLMAQINLAKDTTRPIMSKVLEHAMAGRSEEATSLLLNEAQGPLDKWSGSIQELIDLQESLNQQTSDTTEKYYNFAFALMLSMSISAILFGLFIAFFITRSVIRPLAEGVLVANSLANGDLTMNVDVKTSDETGQLMSAMKTMSENLRNIISQIGSTSTQVASAANELHTTAERIATGAEEVAAQAGTVATAGEEMSATSGDIAQNCQMAAEGAHRASQTAQNGAEVVEKTVRVMGQIAEKVQDTAKTVENLGARSDQIGNIIGTIEDIADQTNLLALNAAIEAARAGEQGRGFAVVADEVRALAERTTRATKEIGEMIKAIQKETKGAVVAMEQGVQQVKTGTLEAARSGEALRDILQQVNDVAMQVNQIATAAEEQTATTGEISNNMQQITEVVQQTSLGAHESATAAAQLSGNAEELQRLVHQFKL